MDQFEELEKYKNLLDSGAITEEEFAQMKQKLLGLKTDEEKEAEREAERAEALKEIESMREAEKKKAEEAEHKKQEEQAKAEAEQREKEIQESKEKATKAYSEEKAKEKARLDAEREHEDALKAERNQKAQDTFRKTVSVIKSVVLWIACIGLIIFGIPSLVSPSNIYFLLFGIVSLILAIMACPLITSKTKDILVLSTYYHIKVPIVIVLVILAFAFMILAGSALQ